MAKTHAHLYFIHAISPLHAGTGEGLGAINLPTARERITGFPYLPGSSVKGVLRERAELEWGHNDRKVIGTFGPNQDNAGDARGGIAITDANLLALPVRSLLGGFGWVTCPYILKRLERDAREAGLTDSIAVAFPTNKGNPPPDAYVTEPSVLRGSKGNSPLYLDELEIREVESSSGVTKTATWIAQHVWQSEADRDYFCQRFTVINDRFFALLVNISLEIRNRVKIDRDTGTAAKSGPWTEEHMPTETVLFGLTFGRSTQYFEGGRKTDDSGGLSSGTPHPAKDSIGTLSQLVSAGGELRFGGKSTIGLGRAHFKMVTP